MRLFLLILVLIPFMGIAQKKETKEQKFYREYWEEEAKKEKYNAIFEEADKLFAQEKFYPAIEKYQTLFEIFPNDQQATARIRDIEIILIAENEPSPEESARVFIPIEKLHFKQSELKTETFINQELKGEVKSIPKDEEKQVEEKKIEHKVEVIETEKISEVKPIIPKHEAKENSQPKDIRQEIAKQYQDGFTEEIYTKANRKITKRVIVKNGLGDEYQKIEHQWGGKFYFKNGEPITQFIWEKETEVERP